MTGLLDLGTRDRSEHADAQAGALIDALAARVGGERGVPALNAAVGQIRARASVGLTPIGMYRLAEVLTPAAVPPAPRQPVGEASAAVDCVRRYPSVVLDAADPGSVARMLAALVSDGLRMLVTGPDGEELAAVRAALPAEVAGLCLAGPAPLSATELRELRALLATSTPERAARRDQLLPDPDDVPDAELVGRLCKAAGHPGMPPRDSADLVPELLGELTAERLTELIETARGCDAAVSALDGDEAEAVSWSWQLVESLLFGQSRPVFDRLLVACRQTEAVADGLRDVGHDLSVVGTVPPEGLERLRRYADFLDAGGRSRSYFRSPEQRAVEPVLRQLRLENAPMPDSSILRQALAFVELIAAVERIRADCRLLELPEPPDVAAVVRLRPRLEAVAAAARAVEALRHEVLFIHPTSPVSMPDMATTEAVTRAIIDFGGAAEMADARRRLTELTEAFTATLPAAYTSGAGMFADPSAEVDLFAPAIPPDAGSESGAEPDPGPAGEHGHQPAPAYLEAVAALREHRLGDYLDAVSELTAARRERTEEQRLAELLGRLRAAAPGLAEAWQRTGGRTFAPGTVRFLPVHEVLTELPGADVADVVLLLGADALGAGYLAVAAAAPRLLVASSGVPVATPPRALPSELGARLAVEGETVATMLLRAAVPVVTAPAEGGATEGGAPAEGAPEVAAKTSEPAA